MDGAKTKGLIQMMGRLQDSIFASVISARGIVKAYDNLTVLKGVDLDIKTGEIVSIVGASGAGKSTLLHILGTLDRPDSGTIKIDESEVFSLSDKDLAAFRNQHIGFVFQFHNLLPEFSALENVCIPGFIADKPENEVRERGRELLNMLVLSSREHHQPSQLSGGEQQRVSIARALMNSPKIILADEPSGNLDSKNAVELHELFFELRDKLKQTFVLVTHNMDLAEQADRCLEIADGRINQ